MMHMRTDCVLQSSGFRICCRNRDDRTHGAKFSIVQHIVGVVLLDMVALNDSKTGSPKVATRVIQKVVLRSGICVELRALLISLAQSSQKAQRNASETQLARTYI
eukprot:1439030-Amphidinium_carterae.1